MDTERYNRHIILPEIGIEGQKKLNKAKVLVIGSGGLGSPVLMYLTAAGIGRIGIVDDDVVSKSNLQRQILYTSQELGELKVEKAKARLLGNNPDIIINTFPVKLNRENAQSICKGYDIIVDCTDNYASRYIIDEVSKALKIPMVYASISKFSGQVSVFNYRGSQSYSDLFEEAPFVDENDASRLGVLGVLPGIVGSLQANEVIKLALGLESVLVNKLLLIDTKSPDFKIIDY